jgi:hypothetical protein
VKHRREEKKVIATNEANLYRALSPQPFLKMNGSINPAETTTEDDDSSLAPPAVYPDDH